jgi:hypothetical protein
MAMGNVALVLVHSEIIFLLGFVHAFYSFGLLSDVCHSFTALVYYQMFAKVLQLVHDIKNEKKL